ncbi:MucR family transcriptional regulator [Acetobacteraceae bacterium]|nr:MucR family transcriptional regulator [Acetobacteraceae bacterium]QCE34980.1 MucR family transcriptional regulator [Acetobacteraceae bacterium]
MTIESAAKNGHSTDLRSELRAFTTEIVSAYVSAHTVPVEKLSTLISEVYSALEATNQGTIASNNKLTPAIDPKKSVFPDYIICLEDGKKLKLLRRHLKSVYNMTPEEYRARWSLPTSYPMVAPNYAKQRSQLAQKIGLGHQKK